MADTLLWVESFRLKMPHGGDAYQPRATLGVFSGLNFPCSVGAPHHS